MVSYKKHKLFIGIASIIILVTGIFLGSVLAIRLGAIDLEALNIGLALTNIILLLIIGGFILEIMDILNSKKR